MSDQIKPGYYLAIKPDSRPGVCQYVNDGTAAAHWRNFNDDRVRSSPKDMGYKLYYIDDLTTIKRKLISPASPFTNPIV